MTQRERETLARLLAMLPSCDVQLAHDGMGVTVYDPANDHRLRIAVCYDPNKAELIVACLRLAQELVAV